MAKNTKIKERLFNSRAEVYAYLEACAKYVMQRSGQSIQIKVRPFPRMSMLKKFYGMHDLGTRTIYLHLDNGRGKLYTWRFILSVLAHELAHRFIIPHNKRFRSAHRKTTRLLKEITT